MVAIKKLKAAHAAPAEPLRDVQLPNGPFVVRDGQTPVLTEAGLVVVELLAREGCVQGKVAAALGVSAKTFKTLLGKSDDDPPSSARAAWEAGRAALESELVQLALAAARNGDMVRQLFLLKSQFGHRDQGPSVQIDATQRHITFLPASFTEEEYLKKLGISAPIDTRPESQRNRSPFEILGLQPPPLQHASAPTESPTSKGENENANH